jgi:hypothetical protein
MTTSDATPFHERHAVPGSADLRPESVRRALRLEYLTLDP